MASGKSLELRYMGRDKAPPAPIAMHPFANRRSRRSQMSRMEEVVEFDDKGNKNVSYERVREDMRPGMNTPYRKQKDDDAN